MPDPSSLVTCLDCGDRIPRSDACYWMWASATFRCGHRCRPCSVRLSKGAFTLHEWRAP